MNIKDIDKIIVVNYGSQYNELIARRIRQLGIYSQLVSHNITAKDIANDKTIKGIVLSGGPSSIYENDSPKIDKEILELNIPILGICYGMQLVSSLYGGEVKDISLHEYGSTMVKFDASSAIFSGLNPSSEVFMSHGDEVIKAPNGFRVIASSKNTPICALENEKKNIFLLQFHPEVTHTIEGMKILSNFVNLTKAKKEWSIKDFISLKIKEIKEQVGNENVLLGISGGVDSSVAALLIHRAIGDQLKCVFVDHGLLRKNEAAEVMDNFSKYFEIPVKMVDASQEFLNKLSGVIEPEEKRKIIGKTFIDVFNREAVKLGNFKFLAQGTLYTDKVESGFSSKVIKSHHNVGGLPKDMNFQLIEPLDSLFKDEVRILGKELGMSDSFICRQPFPGPGLAIRIVGEITAEKLHIVREADAILLEEVNKAHLEKDIWQYFCALSNMKSVGVMGDNRSYLYALIIRAVTSIDGMSAKAYRFPYDLLEIISQRIINEVGGINRVLYDVTSKPPSTIELE